MSEHVAMGRVCPHCNLSLARYEDPEAVRIIAQLERESDALRKELGKARTICEEIENYAMTANQSVLDDHPEARKEIFRHIRDIARKGCANSFESHTWSENEKLSSRLAAAQNELDELKRDKERLDAVQLHYWEVAGNRFGQWIVLFPNPDGSELIAKETSIRQAIDAAIAQSKVAS